MTLNGAERLQAPWARTLPPDASADVAGPEEKLKVMKDGLMI